MTLDDLATLAPASVAALAGLTPTRGSTARGVYLSPCPCCGATKAHPRREEHRGPIWLAAGWRCHACPEKGGRGDLLALYRYGRRWGALSREERASLMGEAPRVVAAPWVPPARRYVDPDTWAALVGVCVPAVEDRACREWAAGRGLRLTPDLLALPARAVEGLPLWTSGEQPWYLPGAGYRLLLPMCDGDGRIVSARLRTIRQDPRGPKEVALPGYSSAGAVYAGWTTREAWMRGACAPRPCVLVEGGPDRLAAWMAWGREREVVGYVSGSCPGAWLDRLHPDTVIVGQRDRDRPDGREPAGQGYVRQIRAVRPSVVAVDIEQVYRAAGMAWEAGDDLAEVRKRGARLPALERCFRES